MNRSISGHPPSSHFASDFYNGKAKLGATTGVPYKYLDYLDQWPYVGNAIMHGEPGLESA
jgi:hypothetical protein